MSRSRSSTPASSRGCRSTPAPALRIPDVSGPILSGHGTIVAGLVAGREGVAPGARVIDMRVLDTETPDFSQGQKGVSSAGLTAGIRQLVAVARTENIGVVNISLSVGTDDPDLRAAVKDLVARDVVVVASAGNADTEVSESFKGTPGNDAPVYPADYPGVLAVSAVAPDNDDLRGLVAPNKQTDVAAPTYGALSYNTTGQKCLVVEVATSWAAAEVSGVVALLRAAYPRDNAKQIVGRLKATAEGSDEVANPWTGAGVVQAHDALTRTLDPGAQRQGRPHRPGGQRGRDGAPRPPGGSTCSARRARCCCGRDCWRER